MKGLTGWRLIVAASIAVGALQSVAISTVEACSDVTRVQLGGRWMYRYTNEKGELVMQDRPPSCYVPPEVPEQVLAPDAELHTAPVAVSAPSVSEQPPVSLVRIWGALALWLLPAITGLFGLYMLVLRPWRRWRKENPLERALRREGYPYFRDLDIRIPGAREARVEHVVRTPSGVIVLATRAYAGQVRASAQAGNWLEDEGAGSREMLNPLPQIRQQAQLVRKVVGSAIPILPRVVLEGQVQFVGPSAPEAQKHSLFVANLARFRDKPVEERALDAAWRTLMRFPHSNRAELKLYGTGLRRWGKRHKFELIGCTALLLSVISLGFLVVQSQGL